MPVNSAFAYTSEGLLKGLPIYYTTGTVNLASGTYSTASEAPTRQLWTDGNPENGTNVGNNGHVAVRLSTPVTVRSFVVYVTSNSSPVVVKLYDSNLNVLSTQNITVTNSSQKDIPKVSGVKYVEFYFSGASGGYLRELNIFSESVCGCDIEKPTELTATAGNTQVSLNWAAVEGATGYNLKRSLTLGGPYNTVASNVYGTSYTDTTVTNGTTYYYVVTALNAAGESENSNEASATPMGTSRVILTTTMTNGDTFEYNISQSELTSFLAWFDAKAAGNGPAKYTFTNQHLKGSFLARKNSLIFDKIIKINYDEYSVDGTGKGTEVAEVTTGTALSISLTDGRVEGFILSTADYNAFVAWYDAKAAGTGPARYTFENPLKKGPFSARHEVIIFDKISSYDSEDFN